MLEDGNNDIFGNEEGNVCDLDSLQIFSKLKLSQTMSIEFDLDEYH